MTKMEIAVSEHDGFKFIVVDKFFEQEIFRKLSSIKLEPVGKDKISVHDVLSQDLKQTIIESHSAHLDRMLHALAPRKKGLVDHIDLRLAQTGPEAEYPVHEDSLGKILSIVVYLTPEHSTGTLLHRSENDGDPIEIEWRQNRAFVFSRNPKSSWHSYKGDSKGTRRTLLFNLHTNKSRRHELADYGYFGYSRELCKRLWRKL